MPIQMLPKEGSFAQTLGSSLGQGLSSGLQALAQNKIQNMSLAKNKSSLEKLIGPEYADFILAQSPENQKNLFQNIGMLAQSYQNNLASSPLDSLSSDQMDTEHQQPNASNGLNVLQNAFKSPHQLVQEETLGLKKNKEERESRKEARDIKKEKDKSKQEKYKLNKEYVSNAVKLEKDAINNDKKLSRMEELVKKGNLPTAGFWKFLSDIEDKASAIHTGALGGTIGAAVGGIPGGIIGGGIGTLVGGIAGPLAGAAKSLIKAGNPDIEEFEKLSTDFIKNAKQFFGSRVTDFDLRSFMNTIPSLMQTDAGKIRIIDNIKKLNDVAKLEGKITRQILKENKGLPPIDLEVQVYERLQPELDRLAEEFKSGTVNA